MSEDIQTYESEVVQEVELVTPVSILRVSRQPCCGWFLVSNFYTSVTELKSKELDILEGKSFIHKASWSKVQDKPTAFTLHAVLALPSQASWVPELLRRGWSEASRFKNPNTGSICVSMVRPVPV